MPLEITLFILRIIVACLLYAFLGTLLWMVWRDFKATSAQLDIGQRRLGQLVIIESESADMPVGQGFPLLPLTSLGRAPTNSVVLSDSFASGEHALLVRRGHQWWLEDRHSRNGTMLNGERIQEPVVVSAGDLIGVGRVCLRLEID